MKIKLNKIIFFLVVVIVNFQNSFTKIPYNHHLIRVNEKKSDLSTIGMGIGNKILLDVKYKTKNQLIIYKETNSLTIDLEGKLNGYKDVSFTGNKKDINTVIFTKILKKSTLWGVMKLMKI